MAKTSSGYSGSSGSGYSSSGGGGSGGSYSGYTTAWSNPWGDDAQTMNIREGPGTPTYLPNTAGQQDDQQDWQSGENQADRDLNWAVANLPIDWQKQKYGMVFPMAQATFNNKPSMGQSSAAPDITQGGVWSPQQVDQQVNQAKANNAQQTATTQKANAAKTAGQGYGSSSPLLAALNNAAQASLMGNNASSEQNIRWDAAEGNSDMLLKQQTQASNNWAESMDQDIRRKQQEYQAQSSLLSALAGYL